MITAIAVLSVAAGIFLIAAVVFACLYFREKGKNAAGERYADGVKISGGVRYSKDTAVFDADGANISLQKGDFVLEKGKTYTAEKGGALLAGQVHRTRGEQGKRPRQTAHRRHRARFCARRYHRSGGRRRDLRRVPHGDPALNGSSFPHKFRRVRAFFAARGAYPQTFRIRRKSE